MYKIGLFILLVSLSGCSLFTPTMDDEINKVTVVKETNYLKHHRAYFPRKDLKKKKGKHSYLYFYNKKSKDLAVLLEYKNSYVLHNMSTPKDEAYVIPARYTKRYTSVLKKLKKRGFRKIKSLKTIGYTASHASRIFKGTKTLFIETKNYAHLQKIYQNAIRQYNANSVKNIQTRLPKSLISSYYKRYKKRAKKRSQLLALKVIAGKLDLKAPKVPKLKVPKIKIPKVKVPKIKVPKVKPVQEQPKPKVKKVEERPVVVKAKAKVKKVEVHPVVVKVKKKKKKFFQKERRAVPKPVKVIKRQVKPAKVKPSKKIEVKHEIKKVKVQPIKPKVVRAKKRIRPTSKPYGYYLHNAPFAEISRYLESSQSKRDLSSSEYNTLSRKKLVLQEQRLLSTGSLEELIAAYKINKNPEYKKRIIQLIKVKKDKEEYQID